MHIVDISDTSDFQKDFDTSDFQKDCRILKNEIVID